MPQNIAGAVRRVARVLNSVTVSVTLTREGVGDGGERDPQAGELPA